MAFLIGGANSLADTGYDIDNSLRFNNDDSPDLAYTPSSAGNRRTFTLSVWFKLQAGTTGERVLLSADDAGGTNDNTNFDYIAINGNDKIFVYGYEGSENQQLKSTQILRDPAAWYHLVVAFDTTQGTAANRVKIYLNGSQVTVFDTANYPDQNLETRFNNTNPHKISRYPDQAVSYFDGYMAEYHLIDGSAKAPTDFGEVNDNGVWIPKDCKDDLTYGTNGYYLEFKQTGTSANASGMGADTSGNTNHLTPSNLTATDVTTDTPTNNFATMNPLDVGSDLRDNGSFAEGNLEVTNGATSGQADQQRVRGTIAVTKGKWYFEMKQIANSASIGVLATEAAHGGTSANSMLVEYNDGGEIRFFNGSGRTTKTTGIDSFDDDDIVGCALDMDNRRAYFHKNGAYQGDPTPDPAGSPSGAGQFGGIQTGFTMAPCMFDNSSGSAGKGSFNFGNAPFAISSGNADANGFGNFEFAVPSGYFALCTKNLAQFG